MNGKDVSSLPHEDAVEEFLKAEEPILIEVKRRHGTASERTAMKNSTNTNDSNSHTPEEAKTPKEKSIPFTISQKSTEICSTAIQTDLMLCDFENEYISQSDELPRQTDHSNSANQSGIRSINNYNNNGHHHFNQCAMLDDCIVPPEIDIEVNEISSIFSPIFCLFKNHD